MPIRILIVDDHELMSDGLRMLLRGYPETEVVGSAGDGTTALRLAGELQPDLILMDIDLPDGSGIAVTGRIRDSLPTIKVLMLTGHLDRKFATAAIEAGAKGYMIKTKATTELIQAIRTVMAGGFHLSSGVKDAPWTGGAAPAELGPAARELPLREGQVLKLLLRGARNKEIADDLKLSVKTVETYRARLMKRFNCTSVAELVIHAIREGLATP